MLFLGMISLVKTIPPSIFHVLAPMKRSITVPVSVPEEEEIALFFRDDAYPDRGPENENTEPTLYECTNPECLGITVKTDRYRNTPEIKRVALQPLRCPVASFLSYPPLKWCCFW